jgi:hypothetical protein
MSGAEFHPEPILETLRRHEVDFVVVGGLAMKEAAGRPKDLLQAGEYRVISDALRRPQGD